MDFIHYAKKGKNHSIKRNATGNQYFIAFFLVVRFASADYKVRTA